MKSNFLIFLFLFSFFASVYAEDEPLKKAYLLNVNGISIYKSKDINRKIGALNYKDEFFISQLDTKKGWTKIAKGKRKGFIRTADFSHREILVFTNILSKSYIVTKKIKNQILEKPFSDAKVLSEREQFSLLEALAYSSPTDNLEDVPGDRERWYELLLTDGRKGYVKEIVSLYDSIEKAKSVAQKKQLHLSGYVLVSNPIYLDEPGGKKKEDSLKRSGLSKKGEFLYVKESREVQGVKYFYTVMSNPSRKYKMEATPTDYDDTPLSAWISEKDAKYFSPVEFSRYTLENSTYTKDRLLLDAILAQNDNLPLNFLDVYIKPLGAKNKKWESRFFIASLYTGYINASGFGDIDPLSLVVEKDKKNYKVYTGNIQNRGKLEFFDLDKDGTPEIFSSMDYKSMSRVAFTAPAFYAYRNGAYEEIPLPGNFLDNYEIDGNFLYIDKREDGSKKKDKKKYKYLQGKFVEVQN
jgi:hypothetical protein